VRVGLDAGDADEARKWRQPSAQSMRHGGGDERRRYCRRHRQAADAAAIGTNCIPCSIGRGGRLIGDNAMTNNIVGLRDGVGRRARGTEIRDQAGERNGISGGQRNNALPQCPLREPHAHNLSPPLVDYEHPSGKEIPSPAEKPFGPSSREHCRLYIDPAVFGLTLRTHQLSACPCASCPHDLRSSCRCRFQQRPAQMLRWLQWGIGCQRARPCRI
jgi:hypothetical protein